MPLTVVAGVLMDQITTRVVLRFPTVYETNKLASTMMSLGLWFYMDALIIAVLAYLWNKQPNKGHHLNTRLFMSVFMAVYALMRSVWGINNLIVLMNVI